MTFKIGDIVVPKTEQDLINEGYNTLEGSVRSIKYCYTEEMWEKYGGKPFRISAINSYDGQIYLEDTHGIRTNNWDWSEAMFRPEANGVKFNYISDATL